MRSRTAKPEGESTYTFECECGFTSSGWPTKTAAADRGADHELEHETGVPMRAIGEVKVGK